jgi:hypothetical protein
VHLHRKLVSVKDKINKDNQRDMHYTYEYILVQNGVNIRLLDICQKLGFFIKNKRSTCNRKLVFYRLITLIWPHYWLPQLFEL